MPAGQQLMAKTVYLRSLLLEIKEPQEIQDPQDLKEHPDQQEQKEIPDQQG
jgi:hypothetical protein